MKLSSISMEEENEGLFPHPYRIHISMVHIPMDVLYSILFGKD